MLDLWIDTAKVFEHVSALYVLEIKCRKVFLEYKSGILGRP